MHVQAVAHTNSLQQLGKKNPKAFAMYKKLKKFSRNEIVINPALTVSSLTFNWRNKIVYQATE